MLSREQIEIVKNRGLPFDTIKNTDKLLRELCDMALGYLALQPRPIADAPKDGTAVLGFGIHTHSPVDAQKGVEAGDYWWAIMQWDVWRKPEQWVFCKDGKPTWSAPSHFYDLSALPRPQEPK